MAVAVSRVRGSDDVWGTSRKRVVDIALSGNYPAAGEAITARSCGLKKIVEFIPHGAASEVDLTGAWVTKVDYQTDGSVKLVLFESAGSGAVPTQKPAEAYESAGELRATVLGI